MAKKSTTVIAARQNTAVAEMSDWQKELEGQAAAAVAQEKGVGSSGKFFSTKGGTLSYDGNAIPNNEMAVIIVDGIMENALYPGRFDPKSPQSPICFALGRNEDDIAPHSDAAEPQHDSCKDCPKNQWASADVGNGKACKNGRRLALLSAGNWEDDEYVPIDDIAHYETEDCGFLKLAPTSITNYAKYVRSVAQVHKRPPHGVVTKVSLVGDDSTQFKITFECLGLVPDEYMPAIIGRHKTMQDEIMFGYKKPEEQEAPVRGKKPAAKPAAPAVRGKGRY